LPLNYLTFWGRKSAADRIARGDLREFFTRLNRLYKQQDERGNSGEKVPFLGMASIGHSFGGQVLFSSIRNILEDELIDATSPRPQGAIADSERPIRGFGTLSILVNPALEAFQYEKIHELNGRAKFDKSQTPVLMVVSADTDLVRKFLFPVGRWFGSPTRPKQRDGQRGPWLKALGEFKTHVTHSIRLLKTERSNAVAQEVSDVYEGFDPKLYTDDPCAIINFDLSNIPEIGGIKLEPGENHHPYSPFIVARAGSGVVFKHSGIFEEVLRNFLNDYVALTEGKRILLRDTNLKRC